MADSESEAPADRARRRLLALVEAMDPPPGEGPEVFDPWASAEAELTSERFAMAGDTESSDFRTAFRTMLRQAELARVASENDTGPLMTMPDFQVLAARRCLERKGDIDGGDGVAVMESVANCLAHGLKVPGWLAAAFLLRYERVMHGECRGWGDTDAFGAPFPPGTNTAGVQGKMVLGPWAYEVACELLAADPARPIDRALYEAVGAVIDRGHSTVHKLIAQYLDDWEDEFPPLSYVKKALAGGASVSDATRRWNMEKGNRIDNILRQLDADRGGHSPD